ncbi:MAG: hypothetical protein CMI18_05905 [Opitutaceae bacterium]|nr:hypothetical protein [Opitutaceae bacterium]
MNGTFQGKLEDDRQIYTWDLEEDQIRLGMNYVGDLDEVSCFNRALNVSKVKTLLGLDQILASLLNH